MRIPRLIFALLISFLIFYPGISMGGPGSIGGGDLKCDARIQLIAENIQSWIEGFGPESGPGLDLSSSSNPASHQPYTVKDYEAAIKSLLAKQLDASCVGKGDKGFPVEVGGSTKICKSRLVEGRVHMICDRKKFLELNPDERIQQIHHELAIHIPGLEPAWGSLSTYKISVQLSAFTRDVTERKLVVLPPSGSDEDDIKAAKDAIAEMIGSESTEVDYSVKCYSDFAKNDHLGNATDTYCRIFDRGVVHIVLGEVLINQALKLNASMCSDGKQPSAIDGIEEKIMAIQLKNPDGTWKTSAGGTYLFDHKKILTLTVSCTGDRNERKELPLSDPGVKNWLQGLIQRTSAIAGVRVQFSQGQFERKRPDGSTDVLRIASNRALTFDQTMRVAVGGWVGFCRVHAIGMLASENDKVIAFKVTGHARANPSGQDSASHCKEYVDELSKIGSNSISFADLTTVDLKKFKQTKSSMTFDELYPTTPTTLKPGEEYFTGDQAKSLLRRLRATGGYFNGSLIEAENISCIRGTIKLLGPNGVQSHWPDFIDCSAEPKLTPALVPQFNLTGNGIALMSAGWKTSGAVDEKAFTAVKLSCVSYSDRCHLTK
jgi:hypothetical protein